MHSFFSTEDKGFTKLIEEINKDLSKKLNLKVKDKKIKNHSSVSDSKKKIEKSKLYLSYFIQLLIIILKDSKVDDFKSKNSDKTIHSDIQIVEIRERNIESYEISINKENYIYNINFNINFHNENITYPLTLEIARTGRRYFTLYGQIPDDGHCRFHCMNVINNITNNDNNSHHNIRREVLTVIQKINES
uniref:START domain-containing protein n=1 Tax=Strongyloides venezuelensis TaxID=75913 RepID=A0A0K0FQM8_STRVS